MFTALEGMSTKLIVMVILLVLVIVSVSSLISSDPVVASQRILCFGDSITKAGGWVERVGENSAFETINAGYSGRQAQGSEKYLAEYLKKYSDLDQLILFLGVNDLPARDKRPDEEKLSACVNAMEKTIDLALKSFEPKHIILVAPCTVNPKTMSPKNINQGYHLTPPLLMELEARYKGLAQKKGVSFVSLLDVVSSGNYLDGLHPSKAGHREMAQAILSFLQRP